MSCEVFEYHFDCSECIPFNVFQRICIFAYDAFFATIAHLYSCGELMCSVLCVKVVFVLCCPVHNVLWLHCVVTFTSSFRQVFTQ